MHQCASLIFLTKFNSFPLFFHSVPPPSPKSIDCQGTSVCCRHSHSPNARKDRAIVTKMDHQPAMDHLRNVLNSLSRAEGIVQEEENVVCPLDKYLLHHRPRECPVMDHRHDQEDFDDRMAMTNLMKLLEPTPIAPYCVTAKMASPAPCVQETAVPVETRGTHNVAFSRFVGLVGHDVMAGHPYHFPIPTASSSATTTRPDISLDASSATGAGDQQSTMPIGGEEEEVAMVAHRSMSRGGITRDDTSTRKLQAGQWSYRFEELLAFREVHGHMFVPHNYLPNPQLSQWVKR
jgi:Helicase associated domain